MQLSSGFYKWAWGIIEGCQNDCDYCYAKTYYEKHNRDFSIARFDENLLIEPYKVDPAMIFVNHLGDIMGDWVKREWVKKILNVCKDLPEHEFLFMTKLPEKYKKFEFPDNCILGVTIESPDKWSRAEVMEYFDNRKMCSVEPILGDFTGYDFSQFEFVVVGCLIGENDHSNYDSVKHFKIYYTR
jgi:protein gp37